ncbi:hypothetical protein ACHAXT_000662 [Thalassiosira profunda]
MVRVFIKGGVWKNSEDEILKAAVMKYGKQQWARVASLLNRKSAKQCKARWNEWLDPSVRKVEWSRAEDEKLLHLAKLMPAQWRTIGPLVGRTAGQCQERYERLLDEAALAGGGEAGGELGEEGGATAARKLRPGEIDPHPETKPARPDPVDMDEDEIEMLQEARARLANTQGKKAKRKAREKMLHEAKRLADLQKRRELKAAGLLSGEMKTRARKKNRDIDLGVEIPFHKPAPSGFHSTRDEDARAEGIRNQRLKDVDYRRITEAQYRSRDREAKERQRREEARLRSLERSNMQYVVAEVSKRNDPIATRKRGALSLPAPTVGDEELRRAGKAGAEERAAVTMLAGEGGEGGATDALLGDYTDRPLPTPMRTPAAMAGAQKLSATEAIRREATNLRALSTGRTPLLGEENAELLAGGAGTGASLKGAGGMSAHAVREAEGATPMMAGGPKDDATAGGRTAKTNATPLTVHSHRDELGLNAPAARPPSELRSVTDHEDDAASVGASSFGGSTFASAKHLSLRELAREERRRAKRARKELEAALANLPAPQFEYELAAPEDAPMEEAEEDARAGGGMAMRVKDKADEEREELERLRKEAARMYEEQSSVVKRPELPRPAGGKVAERLAGVLEGETALDAAAQLIHEEAAALINHDAQSHPRAADKSDPVAAGAAGAGKRKDKKDKKRKRRAEGIPEVTLEYHSEEALQRARDMLAGELQGVIQEKREVLQSTRGVYYERDADVIGAAVEETVTAAGEGASGAAFSMETGKSGWTDGDEVAALQAEHAALQNGIQSLSKSCAKLEQKRHVQTGGYVQRSSGLIDAALHSFAELQHSRIEESVYAKLRGHEVKGASNRAERWTEEVETLEAGEMERQRRYGELMHEKNRLLLKTTSASEEDEAEAVVDEEEPAGDDEEAAKRKAREKMLHEAKRLADLQKRRELKAAGLLSGEMKTRSRKKNRDIDLGVEIPFHKPAPSGFHSTRDEDARAEGIRNQRLKDVDYRRITEAQYRSRDREAKERQRREEARLRSLERSNMQYVVAEVSKRNDPLAARKRGTLSLPAPTVGDEELRRAGKAGAEERAAVSLLAGEGAEGGATDALLGDYTDRPLPTPMRAPAAVAGAQKPSATEAIRREATNLRALSTGRTPLLGEENAELLAGGAGTGASLKGEGGTSANAAATALGATPMMAGGPKDDATAGGRTAKTNATPLTLNSHRDELGLNAPAARPPSELRSVTDHEDDAASVGASSFGGSTFASAKHLSLRELAREERRRAKRARRELEDALANLPAPQFEYELAAPEDGPLEEAEEDARTGGMVMRVKDKADEEREELERLRKEAARLHEEQSSVVKRPELPRPAGGKVAERLAGVLEGETALDAAAQLIHEEAAALINHDAQSHPRAADKSDPVAAGAAGEGKRKDKKDKKRKRRAEGVPEVAVEYHSEEALQGARDMLAEEYKEVIQEKREVLQSTRGLYYERDADVIGAAVEETVKVAGEGASGAAFSMENGKSGWTDGDEITALQTEHAALQNGIQSLSKSCAKLEQKRHVQTGGYVQRSSGLIDAALHSFAELQHSRIEESVYAKLRGHEVKGASNRAERWTEEVEKLEASEMERQRRYGELMHEKNRLLLKLGGRKPSS